jgi:hypothetical protein
LQKNGYPDLEVVDVEEEYSSGIRTSDEYLKTHRIELDSIVAAFEGGKGSEALWKYVKHKIEELQKEKGFDYSNIITEPEPEELYPEAIDNLILKLDEYIEKLVEDDWESIETELSKAKELVSIKKHEEKNLDVLSKKVIEDETMQDEIVPKINKLLSELSDLLD